LGQLGRIKLFINDEKEQKDLGTIAEIYANLEIALQVAKNLKKQPNIVPENLNQIALEEIKNVLKPGLQI
jgi:hypothetical protein